MFAGPGAGEMPTASSVLGDILAIVQNLECPKPLPMMRCNHTVNAVQIPINETINKYYISITAANVPGVIGCIGEICGRSGINLSSVLQKGVDHKNTAEIVVITEKSLEANIQQAIEELKNNKNIVKINNLIRVME